MLVNAIRWRYAKLTNWAEHYTLVQVVYVDLLLIDITVKKTPLLKKKKYINHINERVDVNEQYLHSEAS